jgi:glycine reductase
MDTEQQAQVIRLTEEAERSGARGDLIVVLGSSDIEGALISAETVTSGDPSFTGPLAGVSLGLPVYHILEPEIKAAVPGDVYEDNVGIWSLAMDIDELGRQFRALRATNGQ